MKRTKGNPSEVRKEPESGNDGAKTHPEVTEKVNTGGRNHQEASPSLDFNAVFDVPEPQEDLNQSNQVEPDAGEAHTTNPTHNQLDTNNTGEVNPEFLQTQMSTYLNTKGDQTNLKMVNLESSEKEVGDNLGFLAHQNQRHHQVSNNVVVNNAFTYDQPGVNVIPHPQHPQQQLPPPDQYQPPTLGNFVVRRVIVNSAAPIRIQSDQRSQAGARSVLSRISNDNKEKPAPVTGVDQTAQFIKKTVIIKPGASQPSNEPKNVPKTANLGTEQGVKPESTKIDESKDQVTDGAKAPEGGLGDQLEGIEGVSRIESVTKKDQGGSYDLSGLVSKVVDLGEDDDEEEKGDKAKAARDKLGGFLDGIVTENLDSKKKGDDDGNDLNLNL